MRINRAELQTVCGVTSKLPVNELPEFAFAGRSNVGKSSLINALVNRKALARTSQQPGKTQTINFFLLNEAFYFVDLPGYGYAKVTKELVAKWGKMIERYLTTSRQLRCIFLLVDIRHEPSDNDKAMYAWVVNRGLKPVVIATKQDKIKRSQLGKQLALIRHALGMGNDDLLLPCSSESKQGIAEIWAVMEKHLGVGTASEETKTAAAEENSAAADIKATEDEAR
ncbi:MAG: YihA family ribosome biogenesis GTP-binding protein [Lachnospiraceae bacterium]|nr:YihA family ribosome biogenesis GTP-binding protein [Lachnospiraceae bacterium]